MDTEVSKGKLMEIGKEAAMFVERHLEPELKKLPSYKLKDYE
jgi:hypothetical protein